jgi:type II secretory ATPase GspE/PulE/Tfp pilus assembly ATPase PilB-like protein
VIGVLAQRLVRVICSNCKEKYTPPDEIYEKLGLSKEDKIYLYRAKGCLLCRHTGYKGRLGIFELMVIDESLRGLIAKGRNTAELKQAALKVGMKTLSQDGFDKAIKGITTLEEVLRVTYESE